MRFFRVAIVLLIISQPTRKAPAHLSSLSVLSFPQQTPFRGSTKPRRAIKPSKIRDVNFIAPARVHAAVFLRPAAPKPLYYTVNL
jgi:hypothetical protein